MLRLTIILIFTMVAGCTTPMIWDRPNTTFSQFQKDDYECERDLRQGRFGNEIEARIFFEQCMISKGYVEGKTFRNLR